MKNFEKDATQEKQRGDGDPIVAPKLEEPATAQAVGPARTGVLDRVLDMFRPQVRPLPSMRDVSKDRTRSMLLLIGGSVGAVLLFIGVFSTPRRPTLQEARSQEGPNLGRPAAASATQAQGPQGSVTPLLAADVRATDLARDQLSPSDISGTSRRSTDEPEELITNRSATARRASTYRAPIASARPVDSSVKSPSDENNPLSQSRDSGAGPATYQYGGALASDSTVRGPGTFSYGGSGVSSQSGTRSATSPRSSIVFVRDGKPATAPTSPALPNAAFPELEPGVTLPPGTRLIARVDAAATSALQIPVVASIEYNYERDGAVAVQAGSKVIGEVRQASADGYVDVRFHTLRTPDGRDMSIQATAMSLDLKPLKGTVSGKNTGKRMLSRTLTGVGTIAAYVVGGGGGLSSAVTGETLLRDRVAGNIAMAGEEQLRNIAYTQNITVTLPANTRFYVVLQKTTSTVSPPTSSSEVGGPRTQRELPTTQELRELMDLRREINRMYQESAATPDGGPQ